MRELLAYSQGAVVEEKLTLRIKADNSGDIYVPVAGYSQYGKQDCDYNWVVSIDDGAGTEYDGVGSGNGKIRVGYGLSPLSVHTVIIRPKEEGYGWLRAFGYKGTSIASSLINIISDKSYKGYAISEIFTGDYYKAYQYYGCNNLINTDEELLPDTLEIIGDNYRYYEYAGCSSLVRNADEKILKTVKVIGDNYRAYQYQNCVGINRINMRAINWASVGNNYRKNQYVGVATDKKQVDVYIEGGIEEGGDWGLVDSNVKGIYVYKGLVSDYQTKFSTITSAKIKKNADWDNLEYEFIEFIGLADSSGKIRIPVGGYSTSFSQDCAYDWLVSIDGGEAEEITGTGSASYVSVGSGLVEGSEHRVVIKPETVSYGWGRAFGYHTTGAQAYIKEIIHDSYKCFASNRTETGDYYKYGIFTGCTNLINSYEKLPTSVETIGDYYMKECCAGCTGLKTAFYEILHKGCSVGDDYRHSEYKGCSSLEVHGGIAGYVGDTYPTNYKYEYLSGAGDDLKLYITRYERLESGLTNSMGLADSNVSEVYGYIDNIYDYTESSYWSNISDSKFRGWYYNYVCYEFIDINRYTKLLATVQMPSFSVQNDRLSKYDRGVGVERKKNWREVVIGATENGKDRESNNRIGYVIFSLTKRKEGDDYIIEGATLSKWNITGGSNWSGTNISYFNGVNYGEDGSIYGQYAENGSSFDYVGIYPFGNERGSGKHTTASAISKNGKMIFGYMGGWKMFYTNTPFNFTSNTSKSVTEKYGNLMFSDDGLKMVCGNSNWTELKQYELGLPRDVESAVDVNKSLSIKGQVSLSVDGKYLFRFDDTTNTLYQYTYE